MSYNDDYENSRREYHDQQSERAGRGDYGDQSGGYGGGRGGGDPYGDGGRGGGYGGGGDNYGSGNDSYGGGDRRYGGGDSYGSGNDSYGGERRHGGGDNYGSGNDSYGGERRHGGGDSYGGGSGGDPYGRGNTGTSYGGGGAYGGQSDDFSSAANTARHHAGNSGDDGLFGQALGFLQQKKQSGDLNDDIDEEDAVRQHQNVYGGGSELGSHSIGTAAAMQALKQFNNSGGSHGSSGGAGGLMGMASELMSSGGGGHGSGGSSGGLGGMLSSVMGGGSSHGGSGGGAQNQFVGMAMAEASKMFDQQKANGNVDPNTDKQSVVNTAAQQALKFYMKSEMGGSGSGGGLMKLAAKFM